MKHSTSCFVALVTTASAVVLVTGTAFVSQPKPAAFHRKTTTTTTTTTTQLSSIPNPLDTLTSGLASIFRLPRGVTAMETPPTPDGQLDLLPRFVQLWDIENSPDCRAVRELLTELDVVVERVIPAASNSRVFVDSSYEYALPPAATIPRLEIEASNGDEYVLSGKEEIVDYLKSLQEAQKQLAKERPPQNTDEEDPYEDDSPTELDLAKEKALEVWGVVGNIVATAMRIGRGSQVSPPARLDVIDVPRPEQPLVLYSYEGNQFCRLVREVLTELDIVYELRSAGKESPRRSELAYITGGSTQCPYLLDPNTNVDMAESKDIIEYLYQNYARWTPPNELLEWASGSVMPLLKPLFQFLTPLQAGSKQEDTVAYQQEMQQARKTVEQTIQSNPVVVYTYEWSPFCTEATALLDRLDVSDKQVSLGKEWIPGLIDPEGAQIRAALLEMTGQSSLPHVFVGGKSIGGLFSGTPGMIPLLQQGKLETMAETAAEMLKKRKQIESDNSVGVFE